MKHHQQGMALIEALLASAVLGIGLLGATQLTLKTLQTAAESRQHTVAQLLMQEAMDCLLYGAAICPGSDHVEVQGVRYTRQTRISARAGSQLNDVQVSVQWASAAPRSQSAQSSPEPTRIDGHSSVAQVPGWVGVSSP